MTKTLHNLVKRHGVEKVLHELALVVEIPAVAFKSSGEDFTQTNLNRIEAANWIRGCAETVKWIMRK